MSDAADLTLLSGTVVEIARDVRLMRLQIDAVASRLASQDGRIGALEQSFHELLGETSRDFGQVQHQLTRLDKRIETIDAKLGDIQTGLAGSTAEILAAIKSGPIA